ncbi:MAG: SusD/RagB family nutrient-binding outer membrane lipoprotein, partial [Bacteroidales bacterium]|nr:SusD/RagB family nutrient-binding outer membrane lipoprotein [Bacteroidales bacterium]
PDLLKKLKAAVAALDPNGDSLGAGDVMLGGKIALWKKYGNALRLRIAARIANVASAEAKTVFEEIAAEDIPADNDDNIFFTAWGSEYGEPWADYYQTRQQEYGVSSLMVNTLSSLNDPRLPVYAEPTDDFKNGVDGAVEFAGYPVGKKQYANTSAYSALGAYFQKKDGLTGFSPWLRSCEVYFAIAYGASKGYNVGMTQKEAYEKAVTLSLEEYGVSEADIETYMAGPGAYDGTAEQLFTQWWISLFKNGQEAWSVYRMSGYPAGNVIAVDSKYPDHNVPPMSYCYPDTEANLNKANYAVEAAAEVDYFWGKKMWWDTRTGIN